MEKKMYKSFKTFREERDNIEFGRKFDQLCLNIIESGLTFDQFWQQHGLPFFISGSAANDMELLEGWNPTGWDWNGLWNGMKNSPTGQAIGATGKALGGAAMGAAQGFANSQLGQNVNNFFNPQNTGNGDQWGTSGSPAPQNAPNMQFQPAPQPDPAPPKGNPATGSMAQPQQQPQNPKLAAYQQQKVGEAVGEIQKQFQTVFKGLIKNFEKSGNKVGAQVAQRFFDKISKYVSADKVFSPMQQIQPTAGANSQQQSANPAEDAVSQNARQGLNKGRSIDGYGNKINPNTGRPVSVGHYDDNGDPI